MITIEDRATAEVNAFERVRALCSDQQRFTAGFRASMESVPTPLASAVLVELNRRELAA